MEYRNINGFNVQIVELEDYFKNLDDGEILEVMKVEGHTMLYRSKNNEIYYVGEPTEEAKDELPVR